MFTERINFSIPTDERAIVDAKAKALGISRSAFFRRIVSALLSERECEDARRGPARQKISSE